MPDPSPIQLVLITGVSGSGKTTALKALEDQGYFCIDNLPIVLLPRLLDLGTHTSEDISRLALVVDTREGGFLEDVPEQIEAAREAGHQVHVVFLDTSDDVLLRRFSETRRRHPLASGGSVEAGIAAERTALAELREIAEAVIDTSALSPHELKSVFQDRFADGTQDTRLSVTVLSFGFKHGLPPQADLVLDCRFLPNPHFIPALKPKTGLDEDVARFVLDREDTAAFLSQVESMVTWLLPRYRQERKAYLTLAVGCTGGRHRSVAIAERIGEDLEAAGVRVGVRHRDVTK